MDTAISEAEATRSFPELLRRVREGDSYTVTEQGRPVARLLPAEAHGVGDGSLATTPAEREAAWRALLDRLESQPKTDIGPWTRDELYDD